MNDSFQQLRNTSVDNKIQISTLLIRTKELQEQNNIAKKQYLRLEVNYTKLLENNKELKETIVQNKEEINLKELEINKIKEAYQKIKEDYQKIKEDYSAAMLSKQKQIQQLERKVEAKELEAQEQKRKFIKLQSEIKTKQQFTKNIYESICLPDMGLEEKFSQLSIDLEKAMEKEVQLTKIIQIYKQDNEEINQQLKEKKQELKKSKAKYVKIQVDFKAQMNRKEQELNGFREIISKYKESRGRIKLVIQLQDALKREYTDELKKVQEAGSITKTRQTIDEKLYKFVQQVGKIAESERLKTL